MIRLSFALNLLVVAILLSLARTAAPQPAWIAFESPSRQIFRMKADGSHLHRLTDHTVFDSWRFPRWSPDGKAILAQASSGNRRYLVQLHPTGVIHPLLQQDFSGVTMKWSDNAEWIVFTGFFERFTNIHRIRADGSHHERLTYGDFKNSEPFWSPDGKKIAFLSDRNSILALYQMDTDGNNTELLSPNVSMLIGWLGTDLLFITPNHEISKSNGKIIAQASSRIIYAVLSPNQKWIFYVTSDDKAYLAHVDGKQPPSFLLSLEKIAHPAWSPDSNWIAFGSADGKLFRVYRNGTNLVYLAEGDFPTWSPIIDLTWRGSVLVFLGLLIKLSFFKETLFPKRFDS